MEQLFRRSAVRARILANPLGPVLEQFIEYLVARGHSNAVLHQYVFAVEHYGQWLGSRSVSPESVTRFLSLHIPKCGCPKPASRTTATLRAALNRLLEMRGVQQQRPLRKAAPVVACLLREYEMYLVDACGLAASTVRYRVRYANELLEHFGVRRLTQLQAWRPVDLGEYVAAVGRQLEPSSGQVLASSVRAFAKFLVMRAFVRPDLPAAIPSFAHWRLAALPSVLARDALEKLVCAVDAATPVGKRDRAVLLGIVDLGLRASDVAALTVDGVDLDAGVLRIEHPKARRVSELPMTRRLATAMRQYVRRGRPSCTSRRLFVIHRAPIGRPLQPMGIRGIVVRYAAKVGLAEQVRGTHVIRHSVACSLINAGASIKDIADLLGHRSIDTTAIYTKVDLHSLAAVAMPWPEVRS